MILYGELTKLEPQDDGTLKVHGVASSGARDSSGEVVVPAAMRAALPGYMAFGAIREMHQPRAAGAALYAEVDEEGATRICAHVVDPTAVKKVRAGVYKGLSIGGKVLARDPADARVITSIRLDEISLVDRPCNPEAVIDLWKAAPQAPTNEAVRAEADAMAKAAGRPGRRNDYVAAARAKLTEQGASSNPLIPAHAGIQIVGREAGRSGADQGSTPEAVEPSDLGPGLRRDERIEGGAFEQPPTEGQQLQKLQADLAAARTELDRLAKLASEVDALHKRLADQAAEIERLRTAPLPPRAAAHRLAKAVGKTEDGETPLSPEAFAEALDALPASERAHLIMKAALSRPIAL